MVLPQASNNARKMSVFSLVSLEVVVQRNMWPRVGGVFHFNAEKLAFFHTVTLTDFGCWPLLYHLTEALYDQEWTAPQRLCNASAEESRILHCWHHGETTSPPLSPNGSWSFPPCLTELIQAFWKKHFQINGVREYRCYLALAWLASWLSTATQNVVFFVPNRGSADAESPAKKVDDSICDWWSVPCALWISAKGGGGGWVGLTSAAAPVT